MSQFEYKLIIKEFHLDTFGHVNNATYLSLFEEARWELVTQGGFGLKEIQQKKQGPVVLEIQIKFLREVLLREEITIVSEILDYTGKVGKMKQALFNSKGEVASEALFTFGLMDLKERKLLVPTKEWLKIIRMSE